MFDGTEDWWKFSGKTDLCFQNDIKEPEKQQFHFRN